MWQPWQRVKDSLTSFSSTQMRSEIVGVCGKGIENLKDYLLI